MTTPRTIIFFGRSGCGKGTQAGLLIDSFTKSDPKRKIVYIETGKKFREFMQEDSYSAHLTKGLMESGGLLPEFLPIWMWTDHMVKNLSTEEHLILDGLCRRSSESLVLDSAIQFYQRKSPAVIHLDVSREWSRKHLLARGRADDIKWNIDERLTWYDTNVIPAMDFFRQNSHYQFFDINGERSIEHVHEDILKAIGA